MVCRYRVLVFITVLACVDGRKKNKDVPPEPRYPGALQMHMTTNDIDDAKRLKSDIGYEWERSGLFEGDMVMEMEETEDQRNIILDKEKVWVGQIPVYINDTEFDPDQSRTIEKAISEIESKSCIKFRKYEKSDASFIVVRGNTTGCWSSVGRQDGGQILHLQRGDPGCVRHGVIVHEFLHALGFYHQQSSFDRDDYIRIEWNNIESGKQHNFRKYNRMMVTNQNLTYDYRSIMHYSRKAFSKNGEFTITPLKKDTTIGQRKGMSRLDAIKLQHLYGCSLESHKEDTDDYQDYDLDNLLE